MSAIIKKVPVPLSGVMLGTAALGNLLQSYSEGIRSICGIVAGLLLILLLLKLIMFPNMIKEDMKNPIMASVSGTFPMALMLLSVYVKPFIGNVALAIWFLAILLHIALIIYFTVKFIFKLQMPKVFASYYIVYVGIVTAAVTAPAYEQLSIGTAAFWFGLIVLIILLMLVTMRYIKYKDVMEPAKPLICIYAAPVSLCAAGYVQSVNPKSYGLLMGMFIVSGILYIFALIKAVGYLRLPFYPSYSAFTFPFVISAIASKQTAACLVNMGRPIPALKYVALIETIIAVILVVYTLVRFLGFIFVGTPAEKSGKVPALR
ncbi:TDT family transporter [Clostridium sp. C105KSO13]|uniref:TDT family transporter n=1 Tax=Clostridium sp. C105KSO13 TaxID=1776045 RepID=UPI0007405EF9|nr:TDT family transporter [Clostridium sp. C105KSO13]CUX26023.1 potassium-tellurite ethidium and proflavin transporter [Clostridium sp. C105KSO13]